MKKIFACQLFLVLTTISLHAQDLDGRRGLVLNLGANNSRFSEDIDDTDCLLALFFGADFILCPSGPLRFSTGMNYSRTGSEYKFGGDGGEGGNYSIETRSELAYLNIPAEAQYEFGAGNIRPFVRGGGTLGFLLAAKNKTKTNFNGQEDESETDIKSQKKSTNLGLNLGGGVSFPLGKYRGVASVRYIVGLTNVVKGDRAPSAKTRDITFSVGVRIPVL